ncbi:B-cell receptor CD22-like [Leptodactylus fuscus]|uniref:B-cell receptor CD22-like n=1 Tax=Leptodactylus fuscus TaxID=238119 RepID=UPI003F4F213C
MTGVKPMFLLIIFQGFYLGSVGQRWTFPSRILALIGSCVEIPCTYHPVRNSQISGTVWHSYRKQHTLYPEILNTKDSSSVLPDYKDRTSLLPGENSCTLRIDPVTREDGDDFYPGIAEDKETNAYRKYHRSVQLSITGHVDLSVSLNIREGEAATMRCSVDHTCRSSPPSLQWNKPGQVKRKSVEISGGSWREESELTYIPSYVDDESRVQCTATYPNGQRTERSKILYIDYAPKNVTVIVIEMDEVIEGSDVTLQCNDFANPDVHEYEWYKGKTRLRNNRGEMTVHKVTRDMEPYSFPPQHVNVTILDNGQIMEGTDVTLVCTSISRPEAIDYEWYKGRNKKLPYNGRNMTVYNVTRNMESYSCTAINRVGRGESAPTEIPVMYGGTSNSNIILLVTIGAICPLLVVALVYVYWRRRCQKVTRNETVESPDATYTDLIKKDIANDYEELKPMNPPEITGGHESATYQNISNRTKKSNLH